MTDEPSEYQESPEYKKKSEGYAGLLDSDDVGKRRKAARMVGELGYASAIPKLVELYENDPDPGVRKNAGYALGMFKAFNAAISSGDAEIVDQAYALVSRVVRTGQIGKVSGDREPDTDGGSSPGMLIGLIVGLVVLLAANVGVFLMGDALLGGLDRPNGPAPTEVAVDGVANAPDLPTLAVAATRRVRLLQANAAGLEAKLTPVLSGEQPGASECPFGYTTAEPLEISGGDRAAYPEVAAAYDTLNNTLTAFDAANQRASEACLQVEPLTEDEATEFLAVVTGFRDEAAALTEMLESAATPPTEAPAEQPDEPEVAPSPTVNYTSQAGDLYNIIDDVQGPRGANTLLNQYWEEAQNNGGVTNGCRAGRPDIPANYTLGAAGDNAPPQLIAAVDSVNLGLQALRDGWNSFEAACAGGEFALLAGSDTGLQVANTVEATFESANVSLLQLLGRDLPGAGDQGE